MPLGNQGKTKNNMWFCSKKTVEYALASYITMETSESLDGIGKVVNEFLLENPKYKEIKNRILDEVQWIIVASGIIAIKILTDAEIARKIIKELKVIYTKIHNENNKKTQLTPEFLEELGKKLEGYLMRFERGIISNIRDFDGRIKDFNELTALPDTAIADFANETMGYITDNPKQTEIIQDNIDKIQLRTIEPDELEVFILIIIRQFVFQFRDYFEKFKLDKVYKRDIKRNQEAFWNAFSKKVSELREEVDEIKKEANKLIEEKRRAVEKNN